ncbi:hypothetical protein CRG98_009292 [Punica granatum]|uniref:Uncharacterized protein n=1 Tax=Punica granatum TaxID=22663 RepID=A0A2I0KPN4_PUNGR|nr:hypothetical protein CRG98_009292 [Punica granatum]
MGARTTEEKQESLEKHIRAIRRTNEQRTPKTAKAGTLALFINGLPERQKSISAIRVKIVTLRWTVRTRAHASARCALARAPPVHSSRTPRALSSPNVHALAPEHSSKRSTESPDSQTLPRLFPRIPMQGIILST